MKRPYPAFAEFFSATVMRDGLADHDSPIVALQRLLMGTSEPTIYPTMAPANHLIECYFRLLGAVGWLAEEAPIAECWIEVVSR